jgi:hypothetical protein
MCAEILEIQLQSRPFPRSQGLAFFEAEAMQGIGCVALGKAGSYGMFLCRGFRCRISEWTSVTAVHLYGRYTRPCVSYLSVGLSWTLLPPPPFYYS